MTRERKPFTTAFRAAGEQHEEQFHHDATCLLIDLANPWPERAAPPSGAQLKSTLVGSPRLNWLAHQAYLEFRRGGSRSPLVLEGLVLAMVGAAVETAPPAAVPPSWLPPAVAHMRAHWRDRPSVSELAGAAGVHPSHFARAFGRWMGCSPTVFLRHLRVEEARRALAGDVSLSHLANELGFSDQSHFSRAFRQATGMTPGSFRRAIHQQGKRRTTTARRIQDSGKTGI